MLFRTLFASLAAAATVALGAAVPGNAEVVARFNPTAKPLATRVYDVADEPLTNAERLRRGMAPMPPKMKRFGLHAPGPVSPGAPEPSVAPPQPSGGVSTEPALIFAGIIKVEDVSSGEILGYVGNKLTAHGQLAVDRNMRTPLEVSFTTTRANQQPGSIEITSGDARAGKYFGAVANEWMTNGAIGTGATSFAYLTRTGQTKGGVGPMTVSNGVESSVGTKLKAQSTIWTADQWTRALAATWTNPGGEAVATKVFYYKSLDALAIVADDMPFRSAHKDAVEVKLSIINMPF